MRNHFSLSCLIKTLILASICLYFFGCAAKPSPPIFYPKNPAPDAPQIQLLKIFTTETDLKNNRLLESIIGGSGGYHIKRAFGVAFGKDKLFIVDSHKTVNGYAYFDFIKNKLKLISGPFKKPIAITVDLDGTRYVADSDGGNITILDINDKVISTVKFKKKFRPAGVAIDENNIYVSDIRGGYIRIYDKESKIEISSFGNGQLGWPTGITTDSDGNIYVAETGRTTISKYDPEGNLIREYGSLGDSTGRFVRPKDVAVDKEGRIYTVDVAIQHVQVFRKDGQMLLSFGGVTPTAEAMIMPAGITIDYDNVKHFKKYAAPGFNIEYLIAVTSQGSPSRGAKVVVYGFGYHDKKESAKQ